MKRFCIWFCAAAMICFAGCFEEKNDYYVNPDGTGKVIHEVTSLPHRIDLTNTSDTSDPQQLLKTMAQDILQNAKGIETWSNVEVCVTDEGKLYFKGTGYFSDIQTVSFSQENPKANTFLNVSLSPDGHLRLAMQESDEDPSAESLEKISYTPEQLQQNIQQQRIKYNQMKPMMVQMLESFKQQNTFHYAGKLISSANFEIAEYSVSLTVEGRKLLAYMDTLMADDSKLGELIEAGKNMEHGFNNPDMYAFFWGKSELPTAEIQLSQMMFDYAQEVEAAKAQEAQMMKQLNLSTAVHVSTTPAPTAAAGTELQNLRIGGVSLVYFEDKAIGYRPLNQFPGYKLSVAGCLPETGLHVKEGKITKALTLQGKSLLPKRAFDLSLDSLKVTDDQITVAFEIELQVPDANETGFEEIAGTVVCFKSEKYKTIDLGVMELKQGSSNETENISIGSAGPSTWGDENEIGFKMKIPEHAFKEIRVLTEDGRLIETRICRRSSSNGNLLDCGIATKEELPPKARIEFVLYDDIQEVEIPFSLKNISLLGKPLNQEK